jgi:D-proline reductase (dithiol) PrdB
MGITKIDGLQSEIYVPVVPPPVWTAVTKRLGDMTVALVTAAGVHLKSDERFNLAGDTGYRVIPGDSETVDLMVTHGGYDNSDVNRDINCMFPIDRLKELANDGFIKSPAVNHYSFMGGGGNQDVFKNYTGPEIAHKLLNDGVDAVVLTAG